MKFVLKGKIDDIIAQLEILMVIEKQGNLHKIKG